MPVRRGIMLKYSDVMNRHRSPASFCEELLRCPGDMPINVFATVNNRWVIGDGYEAQVSLEREFLVDALRERVRRFRRGLRQPSMFFLRPGALLTLKCLLGLDRPDVGYLEAAIGAVALHANDFVESADTSHLSSGVLTVVAEIAPVWELLNIREPMPLLRRSYFIYSKLLQEHSGMQSLFERPIKDLTFAGLPFRKYFPLLFGMYMVVQSAARDERFPTSIPPAPEVARQAGVTVEQFATFAAAKALTLAEARAAFGPLNDPSVFADRVQASAWASDQRVFRNRPLLQLSDGRYLVIDMQFLLESTSAGLSWQLAGLLSGTAREKFFQYWGELFETHVQRLLAHYYPSQEPIGRTYGTDGQIDGLVGVGDDLLVFEVKAGFMREDAKGSRNPDVFGAALRERFVSSKKNAPKGVRQLAATIRAVLDDHVDVAAHRRIYPVLVGEDPVLQTFGLNAYLNDIFREEVAVGNRVRPLSVMLVDELELVLPYVRAGDLSWQELLEKRFTADRVVANSVHDVFYDFAMERRFRERAETFLGAVAEELIVMLTDAFKDLK